VGHVREGMCGVCKGREMELEGSLGLKCTEENKNSRRVRILERDRPDLSLGVENQIEVP
jgi:hypothetical protein